MFIQYKLKRLVSVLLRFKCHYGIEKWFVHAKKSSLYTYCELFSSLLGFAVCLHARISSQRWNRLLLILTSGKFIKMKKVLPMNHIVIEIRFSYCFPYSANTASPYQGPSKLKKNMLFHSLPRLYLPVRNVWCVGRNKVKMNHLFILCSILCKNQQSGL